MNALQLPLLTVITQQNTQNLLASVQGFAGLNTQIQQGTNTVTNAICASETAALTRSFQAQLAAEKCCCETNLNIERQAEATRALIRDQFAQSQAVLICDLKSQIQTRDFQLSQLSTNVSVGVTKLTRSISLLTSSCLLRKLHRLAAANWSTKRLCTGRFNRR